MTTHDHPTRDEHLISLGYTHVEHVYRGLPGERWLDEVPCREDDIPRGHVNYYRPLHRMTSHPDGIDHPTRDALCRMQTDRYRSLGWDGITWSHHSHGRYVVLWPHRPGGSNRPTPTVLVCDPRPAPRPWRFFSASSQSNAIIQRLLRQDGVIVLSSWSCATGTAPFDGRIDYYCVFASEDDPLLPEDDRPHAIAFGRPSDYGPTIREMSADEAGRSVDQSVGRNGHRHPDRMPLSAVPAGVRVDDLDLSLHAYALPGWQEQPHLKEVCSCYVAIDGRLILRIADIQEKRPPVIRSPLVGDDGHDYPQMATA